MRNILLAALLSWGALVSIAGAVFIETEECEGEHLCNYFYSAQQEFANNGGEQYTRVNASVDITCTSSGTYNGSKAVLYCMAMKNVNMLGNSLENSSVDEIRMIQQRLNEQLGNWFCFVQSSTGKIPAVHHPPSEPDHVISLKKSIAAAFQANFEGTEEEEEIDTQSRHKSHYIYTPSSEEGLLKMHRKIRKVDVSNDEQNEDLDTEQDEDIQYRSGRLERSSGNATVRLVNSSHSNSGNDTVSLSKAFAASGSYKMELKNCQKLGQYVYAAEKRRIFSEIGNSPKEEDLKASINKKQEALQEMRTLRETLPSGSALKGLQAYDTIGDRIVEILLTLIELESEYGALPPHTPVIDDVITFIANLPSNRKIREAVVMILSTDGSLRSQMALLNAYDNAMDSAEANVILTHISFMKTVRIGFVIGMEERLARLSNSNFFAHQLLLVFGSLATKGSVEVEDRVMNVLSTRIAALNRQDLSEVDIMLHVLGNTGSKLSISLIVSFLDTDSDNYTQIKLAVIDSLVKVADDPVALTHLEGLLVEDTSVECTAAILETLQTGVEYAKEMQRDIVQYSSQIRAHTLIYSLVEAVSYSNSTDLHIMMAAFLRMIKADDVIFDLSPGFRGKRGTSDWDNGQNSDYNYVDSQVNRQLDVNMYNKHTAFIGANRVGIDDVHLRIAYGFFAGTSIPSCDELKVFGRFKVVGSLLSWTHTLADVKVNIEASSTSAAVVAYARVASTTLLDYNSLRSSPQSNCRPYTTSLAEFRRRLFNLRFSVWIYVGTLSLSVHVDGHFNLDVNANMCIGRTRTEVSGALGALSPTLGITIGGTASASLLALVRGGITLEATFNYRLEPAASIQACPASCSLTSRTCVGVYDSSPNNRIELYAWYQSRRTRLCGSGWFKYPCFPWGTVHTWDSLTSSWNLPSRARRIVWQECQGNLHPTCAERALSSPLFAQ